MNYQMGDIVFASDAVKKEENENVKNHLFVIIDDDGNVVPAEYFGLVVSSRVDKSKDNSNFKYNEPINKNNINNLKTNSIVKCDQLFSIPKGNINTKIGAVTYQEMAKFLNAFSNYLNEN